MREQMRQLAVVTDASTGIGFELARLCAQSGHDLVIAADDAQIHESAESLALHGSMIVPVHCDLATPAGVAQLLKEIDSTGRPVDALLACIGRGQGGAFLDQDLAPITRTAQANIEGTLNLVHALGRSMRVRGHGRILLAGSIAGLLPGTLQAVYQGTKAFLQTFGIALAGELKDTGVTVTCLMPAAVEAGLFERADLPDAKSGAEKNMDAAQIARLGFEALLRGDFSAPIGGGVREPVARTPRPPGGSTNPAQRRH
jgi:short-subunit dehydrogenase